MISIKKTKNKKSSDLPITARKTRLKMLQDSQSYLLSGSAVSAIIKQQVEANQKAQRVGQNAEHHASYSRSKTFHLLKQVG